MPDVIEIIKIQRSIAEREKALTESEVINRQMRAKLEGDKEAIARVLGMLSESPVPLDLDLAPRLQPIQSKGVKKSVTESISVLGPTRKTFSSGDVVHYLKLLPSSQRPNFDLEKNRSNISSYMRDLAEEGLIEMVERGSGRRPTSYKLKGDPAA